MKPLLLIQGETHTLQHNTTSTLLLYECMRVTTSAILRNHSCTDSANMVLSRSNQIITLAVTEFMNRVQYSAVLTCSDVLYLSYAVHTVHLQSYAAEARGPVCAAPHACSCQ
jgi:hypothetical protein